MPQALLPLIPPDATTINELLSVVRRGEHWTYFQGVYPIFQHPQSDQRSFRMFTAQLCCQGMCKQAEIIKTFGVSKKSVLRSVAKYRQEGINGFYQRRKGRGATVMTEAVIVQAQELLDLGHSRSEVAEKLGINPDTLRKSIGKGALKKKVCLLERAPRV
jgi:transposase-like protein